MARQQKVYGRYGGRVPYHETMRRVDQAIDRLGIKQNGYPVETEEAHSILIFWKGEPFRQLWSDWQNGVIGDLDFYEQAMCYIREYADAHGVQRPE